MDKLPSLSKNYSENKKRELNECNKFNTMNNSTEKINLTMDPKND